MAVAGLRLVECGTNRAGSLTTSRPCGPTFALINHEGRTESGGERGRQSEGSTPRPHTHAQINRDEPRGAKQSEEPRAPAWGNKASKL